MNGEVHTTCGWSKALVSSLDKAAKVGLSAMNRGCRTTPGGRKHQFAASGSSRWPDIFAK